MKKTIITVVGNDTVGIIAKVCTYLADNNVNIIPDKSDAVHYIKDIFVLAADNYSDFISYFRKISGKSGCIFD